eukprot:TRINITY_DN13803_c0_g1_i1.p1 TRINITY_DN13803_c0_g1~~TRINITY_DN13803_c0_g1_i1.p1  ORF type:complete len:396 (+),score=64.16 TRINITY_DN13803_c0_g1_i1:46-1188(+)
MEALRVRLQCPNIETTLDAPFKHTWLWSIFPGLAGATFVMVAYSRPPFLFDNVPHASTLQLLLALFGLVQMSSALPTCSMKGLAASQAVQTMLDAVPAYKQEFYQQVGKTLYVSCFTMTVMGVLYGACAWWVFEDFAAYLIFGLASGGAAFASAAQNYFLWALFQLSQENVDTFIATNFLEIDQGEASVEVEQEANGHATCAFRATRQNVDWRKVAKAHYALDSRLQKLWSFGPGAMFLSMNLARIFASGGLLLVIGTVVQHPVRMKHVFWGIGVYQLAVAAVLLMRAASVTSRCSTTTAFSGTASIGSSVNFATCHARMTNEEKITNIMFLQYLSHTHLGVQLFGIVLSPYLVLNIFIVMGSILPIAVGILQSLMKTVG